MDRPKARTAPVFRPKRLEDATPLPLARSRKMNVSIFCRALPVPSTIQLMAARVIADRARLGNGLRLANLAADRE